MARNSIRALGGRLVLREAPQTVEARQDRVEPALRAPWEAAEPAFLGDLGRVALADRPGARRLKINAPLPASSHLLFDASSQACASAGQKAASFAVVEHLANGIALDRDVALGVHQFRARPGTARRSTGWCRWCCPAAGRSRSRPSGTSRPRREVPRPAFVRRRLPAG